MVKEAWDSFKDNIRERVSNPFLGTFILVWIVHNWKIVYAFFYFDKDWKLQQKIDYFNNYWAKNQFFWNLISVALITLGILVITYLFLALSRYLSKIFENIIIPFINKISKGKIVTGETYQSALDKIILLEAKVESERKSKNEAIQERENLEKKNNEVEKITGMTVVDHVDNDKDEVITNYNSLIDRILKQFNYEEIEVVLIGIDKGFSFNTNNKVVDFLLKYDLIKLNGSDRHENPNYIYTKSGIKFKKQFFLFIDN